MSASQGLFQGKAVEVHLLNSLLSSFLSYALSFSHVKTMFLCNTFLKPKHYRSQGLQRGGSHWGDIKRYFSRFMFHGI